MDTHKQLIFTEIEMERRAQDAQWGGAEHDGIHDSPDWLQFLYKQLSWYEGSINRIEERERLIKIAALAVAAIESLDRKAEKK